MGQQYESYWQGHSVDMYGLKIPDELGQAGTSQPGSMAMAVGDKRWSPGHLATMAKAMLNIQLSQSIQMRPMNLT